MSRSRIESDGASRQLLFGCSGVLSHRRTGDPLPAIELGSLLGASAQNAKFVPELLRHASLKVTTDVYMQAMTKAKREAQAKVVRMILPRKSSTKVR